MIRPEKTIREQIVILEAFGYPAAVQALRWVLGELGVEEGLPSHPEVSEQSSRDHAGERGENPKQRALAILDELPEVERVLGFCGKVAIADILVKFAQLEQVERDAADERFRLEKYLRDILEETRVSTDVPYIDLTDRLRNIRTIVNHVLANALIAKAEGRSNA